MRRPTGERKSTGQRDDQYRKLQLMSKAAASQLRVGIVGAGAMGAGIAGLAVNAGIATILYDVSPASLERGRARVSKFLAREEASRDGLLPTSSRDGRLLVTTTDLSDLAAATVMVEAAPEDLDLKANLIADLAQVAPTATLASNTSTIEIAALALRTGAGSRLVGLHFFNPPERMRLVELIDTGQVSAEHKSRAYELAVTLGKRVIAVHDSPGFLVNRCARPYYLESLRIVEDGVASAAEVDRSCVELGGFRMGPFELMDLIGIDVSLAATRAMYVQSDGEPRWRPSVLQRAMVAAGRLGRKSGGGFYDEGCGWRDAMEVTAAGRDSATGKLLLERVVAQLVNEAGFAIADGIATAQDIDDAMVVGLNHPCGPAEWTRRLGARRIVGILDALWEHEHDPRYRVAPLLRRQALLP